MSNVLIVNLVIFKETVRLEDSELIITGTQTLENMVFRKEIKQVQFAMNLKNFHPGSIVAAVERANVDLRIVSPRQKYEVMSCHWETN